MKPMPASRMQAPTCSASRSILTPSACSTSAAPDFDDSARLPCLATGTPAPATMKAAQVEMLNEPEASPPVPTTSIGIGRRLHAQHLGAHGGDRAGDLVDGFAAHAQRHQQAAHLRGRRFARHHAVEGAGGFLAREACAGRDLGDERFEIVGHGGASGCSRARRRTCARNRALRPRLAFQAAARSRKFFSIRWPCSEAMLSG